MEEQQSATSATPPSRHKLQRRTVVRYGVGGLLVLALVAAWALTFINPAVNRQDPLAVARQFIVEVQAIHPHKAYALTTSLYHQNIKEDDFTNGFEKQSLALWAQTPPQLFTKSLSPAGDKMVAIYNVPHDDQAADHNVILYLQKEKQGWGVIKITTYNGLARNP